MDRSLDEFVGGSAESAESGGETDDVDDTPEHATETGENGTDSKPSLTVNPAESTMDWTPGGAACGACESTVERRWRDDGRLVCIDCKNW
ncbi:hypothetical protein ACFPYI_05865 [Halomarina salina]|uniref:DUF7573 domain-containing protein n=1 Tax=Halomarina salina TaxID=1872699 RepID=A0ABD5RKL9_9EURY|nr:hypothetical protein [Halomarina salina]